MRMPICLKALVLMLCMIGCDETGESGNTDGGPEEDTRPEGWSEDSHGKGAAPAYDKIFPSGMVNRIDLEFESADWQAMMDEMEYMLGPFGAMEGSSGHDPVNLEACEGGAHGDPCVGSSGDTQFDGVCVEMDYGDVLVCYPTESLGGPPSNGAAPILVPWDPMWVPCTVRFDGDVWTRVGMRFKGNSTLTYPWMYGDMKLPFKLDFDEFEGDHPEVEDQRFWGFKKVSFANNARDSSYIRDKVGGDTFREFGVPAPPRAFYEVHIDHGEGAEYFGLFTMADVPGKNTTEEWFGAWGGNLYKPDGPVSDWTGFDEASFPKKSNQEDGDWSDVEAAVEALNAEGTDAAAWRDGLESVFDVDGYLRWLAVNTVIRDWDTYGYYAHNYYLYGDPEDGGRLKWIPWDHNECLRPAFVELDFEGVTDDWPLLRKIADDVVYAEQLRAEVEDFVAGPFAAEEFLGRLEEEHELIEPYVIGDIGEPEDHLLMDRPGHFDLSYEEIVEFYSERLAVAEAFVDESGG